MTMRKNNVLVLAWALVVAAGTFLSGCAAPGRTKEQVNQKHRETIQNNLWQFQDDVDAVFLLDRPSRLSDKMVR
jgi:hypothetical protein